MGLIVFILLLSRMGSHKSYKSANVTFVVIFGHKMAIIFCPNSGYWLPEMVAKDIREHWSFSVIGYQNMDKTKCFVGNWNMINVFPFMENGQLIGKSQPMK